MKSSSAFKCATYVAHFFIAMCASYVFAAVPVEDRSHDTVQPAQQTGPRVTLPGDTSIAVSGSDGRLTELFYQLQQLRQEVQMLRGLVEEQGYRLNRLSKDQKEQYLDLDQRVSSASRKPSVAAGSNGDQGASGRTGVSNSGQSSGVRGSQNNAANGERETYTIAFNLMKGQKFSESVTAFENLIVRYPNGVYTPNSFYWLGEIHLATSELEMSRQSFVQVINLFPQHQKVPDTLYKLGVVYHRLEDVQRANEYLQRVQNEYPNTPAASLAKSYWAELR